MPITPSTYATNSPVTAHELNQDLYTIDGSYFNANGVMFHSNRPLVIETLIQGGVRIPAAKGGSFTQLGGANGDAISVVDNAAIYGTGSDGVADQARFASSGALAPSSFGIPGEEGGWTLMVATVPLESFSSTGGVYGVYWHEDLLGNEPLLDIGCMQPTSDVYGNAGFAIDLIQRFPGIAGQTFAPGIFALDANGSSNTVITNTVSTVGQTPRYMEVWMGVGNGNGVTVPDAVVPMTAVTGVTQLSAGVLNDTIGGVFDLLNYPPMLNLQVQSTAATTANAVSTVPFTVTPLIDSYSGYATATTSYTVPLSGWYFCHGNYIYATAFTAGTVKAGIQVNGTNYYGGAYTATPVASQNTGASVTKLLDLEAGDVIKAVSVTSAGTNYGNANVSHFILTWMAPLNSSVQNWTPPDVTGFTLSAGTPPESVTSLTANPYFAFGSSAGWSGYNGSYTVTSSPAAGAPYQYAAVYVNNGSAIGALEGTSANTFAVLPNQVFYPSAWVHATSSPVQLGFDFMNKGTYVTTVTADLTVPTGTWTNISTALTVPSMAINAGYVRIGFPTANGATLQTQAVLAGLNQPLSVVLNQRLANDVNFLYNRPVLSVHQTAATTANANANFSPAMQAATGLVHASLGDNYGGWGSGANAYTAQVAGWYLAMTEINSTTAASSGSALVAGFSVPTSGGITAPTSPKTIPDWYQELRVQSGWTHPTGATAVGCYYLLEGESIAPSAQLLSGTASTTVTDVTHGFDSHFDLVWLSN